MTKPHTEGHYWAKQIASEHDDYAENLSGTWEVVLTYDNGGGSFDLRVLVAGHEFSDHVDNFQWGPRVIAPKGCE